MQADYVTVAVSDKDTQTVQRSLTGRFPMLELADRETTLSEPLSIARYFANNKLGFYGPDPVQRAKIDEWIDIISVTLVPMANSLLR